MAADRIKIIPEAYWDALAAQITLRPFVKTVLYQGRVGSCAAESSVQSLMIARAIAGLPHVVLNPYFVYHTTSRGRDGGSSIDDNLAFLMRYGCAPESVWPRSKGWQTEPSAEAVAAALEFRIDEFFDVASVPEMVSSNLDAFPVVFGAQGHAICAVAHKGSYPLIVNSYDVSWQDGGFGKWVNYSGINWSYGAFAVRVARET
jgi:hypothetical protein